VNTRVRKDVQATYSKQSQRKLLLQLQELASRAVVSSNTNQGPTSQGADRYCSSQEGHPPALGNSELNPSHAVALAHACTVTSVCGRLSGPSTDPPRPRRANCTAPCRSMTGSYLTPKLMSFLPWPFSVLASYATQRAEALELQRTLKVLHEKRRHYQVRWRTISALSALHDRPNAIGPTYLR